MAEAEALKDIQATLKEIKADLQTATLKAEAAEKNTEELKTKVAKLDKGARPTAY